MPPLSARTSPCVFSPFIWKQYSIICNFYDRASYFMPVYWGKKEVMLARWGSACNDKTKSFEWIVTYVEWNGIDCHLHTCQLREHSNWNIVQWNIVSSHCRLGVMNWRTTVSRFLRRQNVFLYEIHVAKKGFGEFVCLFFSFKIRMLCSFSCLRKLGTPK